MGIGFRGIGGETGIIIPFDRGLPSFFSFGVVGRQSLYSLFFKTLGRLLGVVLLL